MGSGFQDQPVPIGEEQTISAPHMHAEMLELLSPHLPEGGRALDVGAGDSNGSLLSHNLLAIG
jgi:protein-L-isoaspartate O-methyltransferase